MTDRHEASVMDLFANHANRFHKSLPSWVDVRRLRNEWEGCLEHRRLRLRPQRRQAQAVHRRRTGGHVPELDENLGRDMQQFAASVQLEHGAVRNRVLHNSSVFPSRTRRFVSSK